MNNIGSFDWRREVGEGHSFGMKFREWGRFFLDKPHQFLQGWSLIFSLSTFYLICTRPRTNFTQGDRNGIAHVNGKTINFLGTTAIFGIKEF